MASVSTAPLFSDLNIASWTIEKDPSEYKTLNVYKVHGDTRFQVPCKVAYPPKPISLPRTAEGQATRKLNTYTDAYGSNEPLQLTARLSDDWCAEHLAEIDEANKKLGALLFDVRDTAFKPRVRPSTAQEITASLKYGALFTPVSSSVTDDDGSLGLGFTASMLGWGSAVHTVTVGKTKSATGERVYSATWKPVSPADKTDLMSGLYLEIKDADGSISHTNIVPIKEDGKIFSSSPVCTNPDGTIALRLVGPQDIADCEAIAEVSLTQLSTYPDKGEVNKQLVVHALYFQQPVVPSKISTFAAPPPKIASLDRVTAHIKSLTAAAAAAEEATSQTYAALPPPVEATQRKRSRPTPGTTAAASSEFSATSTVSSDDHGVAAPIE